MHTIPIHATSEHIFLKSGLPCGDWFLVSDELVVEFQAAQLLLQLLPPAIDGQRSINWIEAS